METRPYDPETDAAGLWELKERFEHELGALGGEEKADSYGGNSPTTTVSAISTGSRSVSSATRTASRSRLMEPTSRATSSSCPKSWR